jgi:hypothetical protein
MLSKFQSIFAMRLGRGGGFTAVQNNYVDRFSKQNNTTKVTRSTPISITYLGESEGGAYPNGFQALQPSIFTPEESVAE